MDEQERAYSLGSWAGLSGATILIGLVSLWLDAFASAAAAVASGALLAASKIAFPKLWLSLKSQRQWSMNVVLELLCLALPAAHRDEILGDIVECLKQASRRGKVAYFLVMVLKLLVIVRAVIGIRFCDLVSSRKNTQA